jgi:outer membrane protein
MSKKVVMPITVALALISGGCFSNRAMIDPWSYAPPCPETSWDPPKRAQQRGEEPVADLPPQDGPLSLAELLDTALKNNALTKKSWAQARSAAAQYAQSQSVDLPNLEGQINYSRIRAGTPLSSNPIALAAPLVTTINPTATPQNSVFTYFQTEWGPQLLLSYTIFDFGQARATSEAARQALYFADWTHNRQIQTLIQSITTDYYDYLYNHALLVAYQEDLATDQATLDAATLELEMGVKSISDVLQAKTQLLQKQVQLNQQRKAVQNSYAQLLADMGVPSTLEFVMEGLPKETPPEKIVKDVECLIQIALDKRGDLQAAEADVRSKEQSLKAAKRQYWPTLDYNFNVGRTYFDTRLNDNYDFTNALSLSIPIFSGYYQKNGVRLAEANKKVSEANLLQVQLNVIKEISTAHYNVKIAYETLLSADAFLAAAQQEYRVALAQYKAGLNTILEVLSAQSSLANARAQRVQSLQQWYLSLSTLAYATGIISEKEFK